MAKVKKIENVSIVFRVLVLIVAIAVVIGMALAYEVHNRRLGIYKDNTQPIMDLNTGWVVMSGEDAGKRVELPCNISCEKGETVVMRNTLPDNLSENTVLCFKSYFKNVAVSVDGVDVYNDFEKMGEESRKELRVGLIYLDLPRDCSNKLIVVKTMSPYSEYAGQMLEARLGTSLSMLLWSEQHYTPVRIMSMFFLIFGLIELLIAYYAIRKRLDSKEDVKRTEKTLGVGFLGIILSLYMIANSTFFLSSIFTTGTTSLASIITTMLVPIGLCAVAISFTMNERIKKCLKIVFLLIAAQIFVSFALKILFDVKLAYWVPLSAIFNTVCSVCVALIAVIRLIKLPDKNARVRIFQIVGRLALGLGALYDSIHTIITNDLEMPTTALVGYFIFSCTELYSTIYNMSVVRQDKMEADRQLAASSYQIAINQMQPHFVYNVLGAIRNLVKKDPDKAYDAIYDFSKYLRQNLSSANTEKIITFDTELDHVKKYISLELLRFGDRINIEYDIRFTNFHVSPLSIQPFVENAIKHGVCQRPEGGTILIQSYRDGDFAIVRIIDDGIGFDVHTGLEKSRQSGSIGISNVKYRLESMFSATIQISSAPDMGTDVMIKFPLLNPSYLKTME